MAGTDFTGTDFTGLLEMAGTDFNGHRFQPGVSYKDSLLPL